MGIAKTDKFHERITVVRKSVLKKRRKYCFLVFWLWINLHSYSQNEPPHFEHINNKGTKCVWFDSNGKELSKTIYDCQNGRCNEGICIVVKDHKYGAIDYDGNLVIPLVYEHLELPLEGLIAAKKISLEGISKWGYIDYKGKTIIPFKYVRTMGFWEGYGRVVQKVNGRLKTGFINKKGVFAIPPQYYIASVFQEGLAAVRLNDKSGLGYVDIDGNPVTETKYCIADSFENGIARVAINCNTKIIGGPEGHATYSSSKGFIDKTGKEIIPVLYDEATHWESEKIVLVTNETGTGAYDEKGNYIIPIVAGQEVQPDKNSGLIKVKKIDKNLGIVIGYLNNEGKTIIPFQFEQTYFENEYMVGVKKEEMSNEQVSDKGAKSFESGRAGVMDTKGNIVIPFIYEKIWYLKKGYFLVRKNDKNGKSVAALYNSTGEIIIPFKYKYISSISENGYVLVKKDNDSRYQVIDTMFRTVSKPQYDEIIPKFGDGLIPVKRNGKWGYINEKDELIIQCWFDSAGVFENGRAIVSKKKKYGFIDNNGETVIPILFDWSSYHPMLRKFEKQERIKKWKYK